MVDFTIAIPTFNGEQRLPAVLDRLHRQTGTEQFRWEIVVVDNNSTDQTAQIVRHYQQQWTAAWPLRYCTESKQGAAFARQRAVEMAQGEWIGFLDDDNWPAPDWVAMAYAFGRAHPQAGAYGGRVRPRFEPDVQVPERFEQIAPYFAIVERGAEAHQYQFDQKMLPPGAGLVVQRQAWLASVPHQLVLNHRGKEAFLASEDLEAVLHIQKAGWQIWYAPTLEIWHHIPAWRLEPDYLLSLVRCIGLSRHHIRMMRWSNWQQPAMSVLYFGNDLRRYLLGLAMSVRQSKRDVVTACELEMLWCSLISPFFWLMRSHLWRAFFSSHFFSSKTAQAARSAISALINLFQVRSLKCDRNSLESGTTELGVSSPPQPLDSALDPVAEEPALWP
ncbi:MAG: hormogonium polysaccharide biosynthesis glycosyltransferase HpsE [Thainema sp.]